MGEKNCHVCQQKENKLQKLYCVFLFIPVTPKEEWVLKKKCCVSVRPISRSCQGHHKSHLVCVTLTQLPGLSHDLDQNLKICVSVRPISRSCQCHHKSPLVCVTLTKFTGLSNNLDKNLKMCVFVRPISRSCKGHHKSLCVTLTQFT